MFSVCEARVTKGEFLRVKVKDRIYLQILYLPTFIYSSFRYFFLSMQWETTSEHKCQ